MEDKEVISKLKLDTYKTKLLINKPDDIKILNTLNFDLTEKHDKYDLIFIFVFSLDELVEKVNLFVKKDILNSNGYIFFAYPKKGNKVYKKYVGRDDVLPRFNMDEAGFINDSMIKFAKMAAFDDVFTVIGLKCELKKKSKSSQPSQCVADYIDRIPDLQKYFAMDNEVLNLFNNLTPGYQRDWARYVYSTNVEATQQKRLLEMGDILKQGYKSKDLFRQRKK